MKTLYKVLLVTLTIYGFSIANGHAENSGQKSLLWVVNAKSGNPGKVYVFGTIHVGRSDFYPLSSTIESAFSQSEVLAVEADISNMEKSLALAKRSFYQPPDSLDKNITRSLMDKVRAILPNYGIDSVQVNLMKPWMLASTLEVLEVSKHGYTPLLGVELYLLQRAKQQGKIVAEIESIEFQLHLMESLSKQEQEAFLQSTLMGIERGSHQKMIGDIVSAWQLGDGERMDKSIVEANRGLPLTESFYEKINYSRNPGIAKKVEDYLLTGKTHFVAVGSLHLLGKRGIIEILRSRGYQVKQL